MSNGAWVDRSVGGAPLKNGGFGLCASGEPGGEVRLRSGESAIAAVGENGVKAQLRSDVPWLCEFGEAFLMRSSEPGPVAFAGASQWMNGGPGIGVVDGVSQWRNDVLDLDGVSLLTNGDVEILCLDDFGRFPPHTDLVGWDGPSGGVTVDVVEVLNETSACGGDSGGSVAAAVLVAS